MKNVFKHPYSPIGLEISHDAIRMIQVKKDNGSWTLHRAAEEKYELEGDEAEDGSKYFIPPWGSYYVTRVINKFKEERDHIN